MLENFISDENFKILKEENLVHDQKFQEFHKTILNEMKRQAVFMAREILKKDGKRPGYKDFENELTELTKKIVEKKIELLGTYLKRFFW